MSDNVYPCRVCQVFLGPDDRVVEFVELIDGGTTLAGERVVLEGHHDFAHERCWPAGRGIAGLRDLVRGETLGQRLAAIG